MSEILDSSFSTVRYRQGTVGRYLPAIYFKAIQDEYSSEEILRPARPGRPSAKQASEH